MHSVVGNGVSQPAHAWSPGRVCLTLGAYQNNVQKGTMSDTGRRGGTLTKPVLQNPFYHGANWCSFGQETALSSKSPHLRSTEIDDQLQQHADVISGAILSGARSTTCVVPTRDGAKRAHM